MTAEHGAGVQRQGHFFKDSGASEAEAAAGPARQVTLTGGI